MHLEVSCDFYNWVSWFSVKCKRKVHHQKWHQKNWSQYLLFNKWKIKDLRYGSLVEQSMREWMKVEDPANIKGKGNEPVKFNGSENDRLSKKIEDVKMS